MKYRLLSDSIVYILTPITLLLFSNYVMAKYAASAIICVLSIYTIITKNKHYSVNISGILFSIIFIMTSILRKQVQLEFDMYIYDTLTMVGLVLIILLSTFLNKNVFKQIYIDIQICKNENSLRTFNNIKKLNLDNDFKKISLLFISHLSSLILIRVFSIYILGSLSYNSNYILEILVNIGFLMYEIHVISQFVLKLKNNIKRKKTNLKLKKLLINSRVIDIEKYRNINKQQEL